MVIFKFVMKLYYSPNPTNMKRIILLTLLVFVFIIVAFATYVQATYRQTFNDAYPVSEMKVIGDSAMIAHGRYLAYGPAHCASCHVPVEQMERVEAGEELPMIGGFKFELPIANYYTPNITPDEETGIGKLSDGQLYRMLRYNVKHNGEAVPEIMPFRNMSEYDIQSIIAFLRTQPPVRNQVPKHEVNFLGKVITRFVFKPYGPDSEPPVKVEKDSSIVYGKYMAESVANCRGCHTERNMMTGEFTGPEYAGGMVFEPAPDTKGWKFVTPNLTSDPETGVMATWSEEAFINRFRMGRVNPGSPMPYGSFAKFDDTDLKAIYRFIKSLDPVHNPEAGKSIPPKESAGI
jgi:mono/diheme cytochrome c family protein